MLSVDFRANGARAAEIAFEILVNSEWPDTFYSPSVEALSLYVNTTEAAAIDFVIPPAMINRASRVID